MVDEGGFDINMEVFSSDVETIESSQLAEMVGIAQELRGAAHVFLRCGGCPVIKNEIPKATKKVKNAAFPIHAASPSNTPNPNTPATIVITRKVIAIERNMSASL